MVDINEVLEGESSRRKFLRASGAAGVAALSGCIGGDDNSEQANKTSTTEDPATGKNTTSNPDSETTESNQEEGYPTQSSGGFKGTLNEFTEDREHIYVFEVDGMEHINIGQVDGAGKKYREGRERLTLEEALYVCTTEAGLRDEPSEAYFVVYDPELSPNLPQIGLHPVDENGNINQTDGATITGYMDEVISEETDYDVNAAKSELESFFRERIDGDPVGAGGGIDHALDLEEFPYAVEALQSGYDPS